MTKFITLAFIFLSFIASGQRHVDIAIIKINSPVSGDTFSSGQKFSDDFTFTNLGPDSFRSTDLLDLYIEGTFAFPINSSTGVPPHLSARFHDSLQFGTWTFPHDSTIQYCLRLVPRSTTGDSIIDPVLSNNTLCDTIVFRGTHLGVSTVNAIGENVILYPNPAQNSVNMDVTLEQGNTITIKIMDMLGRIVIEQHEGRVEAGKHTFTINTAALSAGMYLYKVLAGERGITGRMNIAR
ncbi:MAG: T9SS type A sorting domain-containing protein [Taibaiella sp.]|nr:T9SS type A sorting domain-containing protein [Taibaiella sp.]